jgi:hypothetical protein
VKDSAVDEKTQGLVELLDQAIEMAQDRLTAKRAGRSDPSTEAGLGQIISGLQYRRNQAITTGFEVSDVDVSLGLARGALECDVPESDLIRKIGDVERYFRGHFVRH